MEKTKKIQTQDAEQVLKKLLKENGFSFKEPKLMTLFDVFKEMSRVVFDCSEDELLFEAGCFDYDGEERFCLSLVRQFTIIEDEGEFDYIEQLNIDILYDVNEKVKELSETIWSYEFEDDFEQFFGAVEKSAAFGLALEVLKPVEVDLYMDEV